MHEKHIAAHTDFTCAEIKGVGKGKIIKALRGFT